MPPGRESYSRDTARPTPVTALLVVLDAAAGLSRYSHSIVPGGLLVTSSTTRLICGTSLVIRVEM